MCVYIYIYIYITRLVAMFLVFMFACFVFWLLLFISCVLPRLDQTAPESTRELANLSPPLVNKPHTLIKLLVFK